MCQSNTDELKLWHCDSQHAHSSAKHVWSLQQQLSSVNVTQEKPQVICKLMSVALVPIKLYLQTQNSEFQMIFMCYKRQSLNLLTI